MCQLNLTCPAYVVCCPSFALPYCTSPGEPYSPALLVFRVNRLFSFLFCHSPLASGRLGVTNGSKLASISSSLESVKLTKKIRGMCKFA